MRALLCFVALALSAPASAAEMRAPSPKQIIYPGDVIREDMLVDAPLAPPKFGGPVALANEDIVGMAAARTLLPGVSIPLASLSPPRAIRAGSVVRMIYVDGGLTITATGSALQDGAVGQMMKLRNEDSGVEVSGRVRADGSVLVNGG